MRSKTTGSKKRETRFGEPRGKIKRFKTVKGFILNNKTPGREILPREIIALLKSTYLISTFFVSIFVSDITFTI